MNVCKNVRISFFENSSTKVMRVLEKIIIINFFRNLEINKRLVAIYCVFIKENRNWGYKSVVEGLPSMYEALSLFPSITKPNKKHQNFSNSQLCGI